jgi:hypothetical protein
MGLNGFDAQRAHFTRKVFMVNSLCLIWCKRPQLGITRLALTDRMGAEGQSEAPYPIKMSVADASVHCPVEPLLCPMSRCIMVDKVVAGSGVVKRVARLLAWRPDCG